MVIYYDVDNENQKYKLEESYFSSFVDNDLPFIASECAKNFWDNHDGWEGSWPMMFELYDNEMKSLGKFDVEQEYDPTFSASEVLNDK